MGQRGWSHGYGPDGGTAWLWGRRAGDVAMGQAGQKMVMGQAGTWHRPSFVGPLPVSPTSPHLPTSLGPPPNHFQPIRSPEALPSSVTRQTFVQPVPLGTWPAAAVAAGQHPWVSSPRRAAEAGGGFLGPHCTPPMPRSPRRGRIWPGEALAAWQAATWCLALPSLGIPVPWQHFDAHLPGRPLRSGCPAPSLFARNFKN